MNQTQSKENPASFDQDTELRDRAARMAVMAANHVTEEGSGFVARGYQRTWMDCPTCDRTHEAGPADCRAFKACEKCGDCYHANEFDSHKAGCSGESESGRPDAVWQVMEESTEEKIQATTEGMLHTAPVDWADRCDRWLTKGAGIQNFPPVINRADMEEVINRLDSRIQHAARLRGYLDARHGAGCGDQGHETGVKWSNNLVTKVRKALGFTYAKSEVTF